MHKNNKLNVYVYLFGIIVFILFIPGTLSAALPQPLNLVNHMTDLLPSFLFSFFWPAIAIVAISLPKIWLLKALLSLPRRFNVMEKLTLATLAETIVEFIFLTLSWWFMSPWVNDLLKNMDLSSIQGKGVYTILKITAAIPLHCFFGTISILVLINFVALVDKDRLRKQYLKFSILLSLMLPILIILIIAIRILFFKEAVNPG